MAYNETPMKGHTMNQNQQNAVAAIIVLTGFSAITANRIVKRHIEAKNRSKALAARIADMSDLTARINEETQARAARGNNDYDLN